MPIDKSWIGKPRNTPEYAEGLRIFLDFAFTHRSIAGQTIKCPCPKCGFKKWQTRDVVEEHLICKPFPENYKVWYWHGEKVNVNESESAEIVHVLEDISLPQNPMETMINEAFGFATPNPNETNMGFEPIGREETLNDGHDVMQNEDNVDFYELLKDGNQELYEGCTKYSKLSFLVKLYHIKCLCRMSDKAITMILELLKDAFDFAKIPASFYVAKKTINKLGLNYINIPACQNDCMLFWGEDENLEECRRCKTSKWKDSKKKKFAKVLRYFPLKPRLQRLFMCSKTAESMRWHMLEGNPDGLMRHPRDSEAWKNFDLIHPKISLEPRNVRLGLASDGFNPFGAMSTNYSIWPVVLIPYNRPPWECMKQTSFILSMIIPGKQMPGNNIDVYLQPLIKDLQDLWYNGVQTLDSSKNEMFRMRAALMWTINGGGGGAPSPGGIGGSSSGSNTQSRNLPSPD